VAILAYFEKAEEGPATVTYRWGDDPDELDRELVMDKTSLRARPSGQVLTIQYLAVARKVFSLRQSNGRWPDRGMTAG
jgi:hypothetical protein